MFVVTVTFVVDEYSLARFLPLMRDNARKSLSLEPDCHRFDVCQHPDRPNEVFLYELYSDAAAFDAHKTMPHFRAFSDAVEPMLTSKSVQVYSLLDPQGGLGD